MSNDCKDCKFIIFKEIKKESERNINYGYCKKLDLLLLCLQESCEHHKEEDE